MNFGDVDRIRHFGDVDETRGPNPADTPEFPRQISSTSPKFQLQSSVTAVSTVSRAGSWRLVLSGGNLLCWELPLERSIATTPYLVIKLVNRQFHVRSLTCFTLGSLVVLNDVTPGTDLSFRFLTLR